MNNLSLLFEGKRKRGRPRKIDQKTMRDFAIFMIVCIIMLFTLLSITAVNIIKNDKLDSLFGSISNISKVEVNYKINDDGRIILNAFSKDNKVKNITLSKSNYYSYKLKKANGIYTWNINEGNNRLKIITINIKYKSGKQIKQRIFLKR